MERDSEHERATELNLAKVHLRLGAFILDAILLGIALMVGGLVLELIAFIPGTDLVDTLGTVIIYGLWLLWHAAGARKGQSPGKQLVGLRVVRKDATPPDFRLVLIRDWVVRGFLGFWAVAIPTVGLLGAAGFLAALGVFALAAVWCVWDKERQCLWDKLLGTHVVHA